ncbi:putative 2-hydroxyisoflavanone dehydratase, Carboxylesterase [Helianthus annuus]|nr:putative 2-hydroxyisoflavanone dehydratase, Carboxylesterase [Helianthus annuus]
MVLVEEKHVTAELLPFLRVHNDGTVERLYNPQLAPPSSLVDGVRSKIPSYHLRSPPDSTSLATRPRNSLSWCTSMVAVFVSSLLSPSSPPIHQHHRVSSQRSRYLTPEHPLPAAYEDSWTALQWVATHSTEGLNEKDEPWLIQHGDFNRLYIGGDSAGANISHHIAMRVGTEELHGGVKILGAFLSHPYFWDPNHSDQSRLLVVRHLFCTEHGCLFILVHLKGLIIHTSTRLQKPRLV